MPPCHSCSKISDQVLELQPWCDPAEGQCPLSLPHCWSTGEREGVLCMLGGDWLEPYVLAALGRKKSAVGQQYLGTIIQSRNRKLKPPLFFQLLLVKFLLLKKCQGKRLLLGELCTFSSCIQLCTACSPPQLLGKLLLPSCSCHNCEPLSFLPNKGSPRSS